MHWVAACRRGLAVPINATTRRIIGALMHDGRVRRGYLGLVSTPAPLTPAQAERLGQRRTLRVVEAVENSPAALSGLHAGDLVLAVDGVTLGDAQSLQKRLFEDALGQRMETAVAAQRSARRHLGGPRRALPLTAPSGGRMSLQDFPRYPLLFGPSPDPPA